MATTDPDYFFELSLKELAKAKKKRDFRALISKLLDVISRMKNKGDTKQNHIPVQNILRNHHLCVNEHISFYNIMHVYSQQSASYSLWN